MFFNKKRDSIKSKSSLTTSSKTPVLFLGATGWCYTPIQTKW